jgi:hypothetical protein
LLFLIRDHPRKSAVKVIFDFAFSIATFWQFRRFWQSFAAFCLHPSANTPPGGRCFVANKRRSAIRPIGHRAVEGFYFLVFSIAFADYQLLFGGAIHSGRQRVANSIYPHPPFLALLLQTHAKVPFDKAVTGLSKAILELILPSI